VRLKASKASLICRTEPRLNSIKDVPTPAMVKYHEVVLAIYWKKLWRKGPGEKVSFEMLVIPIYLLCVKYSMLLI